MSSGPVHDHVRRLFTQPGEELGRFAAFLRFQARLWRFCAWRLHANNLLAMSAALSFRTIFALVPTLVLALLAAGALGVLENSKQSLRQFLDASGFATIAVVSDGAEEAADNPPASGADEAATASAPAVHVINVADEILAVVERVQGKLTFQRIGPIGAALLIWTALSLLSTIEDSLNRVFGAARNRSVVRRILLYWSAMTLGPVVLALAVYIGQRAIAAAHELPVLSWLVVAAGWIGPTLVGVAVVAAGYILLPNTSVNRRAAVGGAIVAVLLWLLARWGFAVYVDRFVLRGNLYGILGALPLFLMWLNLSWMIFLFGAELAHAAANFRRLRVPQENEPHLLTPDDAIAAVLCAARAYEAGAPATADGIARHVHAGRDAVGWLLDRLVQRGILCAVNGAAEPRFVPARPPAGIPVAELIDVCDERGPVFEQVEAPSGEIATLVSQVRERMQAGVRDLTVADLMANGTAAPGRVVRA